MLIDHSDKLGWDAVAELCPEPLVRKLRDEGIAAGQKQWIPPGGPYGTLNRDPARCRLRRLCCHSDQDEATNEFCSLAEEASEYLGKWAGRLGIALATLDEWQKWSRWIYALL